MSAKIFSLASRGLMPWQSAEFTKEQRTILNSLIYDGLGAGAVRDSRYEKTFTGEILYLINGQWEGAPSITFSKLSTGEGQTYIYRRTADGPHVTSDDFMLAVAAARQDLKDFGQQATQEAARHTREIAVMTTRASFHLVQK